MSPAVGILEDMGRVVRFPPAASPNPAPESSGATCAVAGRGGGGLRHLVPGTVAPDRRSAGRGDATSAKGRQHTGHSHRGPRGAMAEEDGAAPVEGAVEDAVRNSRPGAAK